MSCLFTNSSCLKTYTVRTETATKVYFVEKNVLLIKKEKCLNQRIKVHMATEIQATAFY